MLEYYARCRLGKNRVFWCVWDEGCFDGDPPISHGYETTVEAAEAMARQVAGEGAHAGNAHWARHAHRVIVAARRRERPAKAQNAHKVEYVYSYEDWSDTSYPDMPPPEATAHRVHKRTKARLYVEDKPGLIEMIERGLYPDHELRTFVLDRREFEREGHARSRSKGWWHSDFYATPEAAIAAHTSCKVTLPTHVTEALARLGLDESVIDGDELKKAFRRKALAVHPDQGGDERDFLRLEEDYMLLRRHFGYGG